MYDLSIVIPSRNEIFLKHTIEDILKNKRGKTEVIAVLDGYWPDPPIEDHKDVTLVHFAEARGQRGATNCGVGLSKAKYVAKCDAHCSFDEGFDVKLLKVMEEDMTLIPIMRNLHAFDWVCTGCKEHRYQGRKPESCEKCKGREFVREMKWIGKTNPQSTSYCFDPTPHFQYFREFKRRPEGRGPLSPSMSIQGSFFMCSRKKYWDIELCGEDFPSWGSQGIEVACKTWLSGGRVMVCHDTWYAHMFRTQGGDFGFPFPNPQSQINKAKEHAKDLFFGNKWGKQVHDIGWLIDKFWPIPGWDEDQRKALKGGVPFSPFPQTKDMVDTEAPEDEAAPVPVVVSGKEKAGIVYYSDCRIEPGLGTMVQERLLKSGLPIVSVTLQPISFGKNIVLPLERSYLTMFKQILAGIEAMDAEFIFLAEHDVLYTTEHFEFEPPRDDIFYYNKNNWQVRQSDGFALYWDCKKVSQIVGARDLMLAHYRKRVEMVEKVGFSRRMGFEPGTHRRPERVDDTTSEYFETFVPNLDVRHKYNLTQSRWKQDQFRNKPRNWKESHVNSLPGWEDLKL